LLETDSCLVIIQQVGNIPPSDKKNLLDTCQQTQPEQAVSSLTINAPSSKQATGAWETWNARTARMAKICAKIITCMQ